MLVMGSRILWHIWEHDETTRRGHVGWVGNVVTLANAERLIGFAGLFCAAHGRPPPSEVEFRLLCWELHSCADDYTSDPAVLRVFEERLKIVDESSALSSIRKL